MRIPSMSLRRSLAVAVCGGLVAAAAGAVWATSPSEVLLIGPMAPAPPEPTVPAGSVEALAPVNEFVPELDVVRTRPDAGDSLRTPLGQVEAWRPTGLPVGVSPGGGTRWLAVYLTAKRWLDVQLEVDYPHGVTIYVDGEQKAHREVTTSPDSVVVSTTLALSRGSAAVLVRLEAPPGAGQATVTLATTGEGADAVTWSVSAQQGPARFARTGELARVMSVFTAPDGARVLRSIRRHDGFTPHTSIELIDTQRQRQVHLAGDGFTPRGFTPAGDGVLLQRSDGENSDLVVLPLPIGPMRTVVEDEPGLGFLRFSGDGTTLLMASERGSSAAQLDDDSPRRQLHLRSTIPDYTPGTSLYLVDLGSGTRRRLTMAGDWTMDDAVFTPDDDAVVYVRTVPQAERPWFHTEFWRIDLRTGNEAKFADFTAGWEMRPTDLTFSPDGNRLAFLGPPEQVGGGRPEHNVYNVALHILDIGSGAVSRITSGAGYSYTDSWGTPLPVWLDANTLVVLANKGSSHVFVRWTDTAGNWTAEELPSGGETVGALDISRDRTHLAYAASSRGIPPQVRMLELATGREWLVDDPNAQLDWAISQPQDSDYIGPGRASIDAWWYPPTLQVEDGATPLIVYMYAGSSPTLRSFDPTHQWLAANGYAVLVANTRGAYGYGDNFADQHVGDWGPKASADVLAALDTFLAGNRGIDRNRVGVYGGSYGGFMTNYLVAASTRFAAAVSQYGISDLATYWGQGAWGWTYGDMSVGGQTPWEDPQTFVKNSPLYNAGRIETPLLLMHGLADTNVTPGESVQMFTALRVQGKNSELVLFPGENHGIRSTLEVQTDQRQIMLGWFDRFLRNQPEAWEARWKD